MYMYICSSIFVCASLYVALLLIISHKPKKSGGGGEVKYAALDIFGETLSKPQLLLRKWERSLSILH